MPQPLIGSTLTAPVETTKTRFAATTASILTGAVVALFLLIIAPAAHSLRPLSNQLGRPRLREPHLRPLLAVPAGESAHSISNSEPSIAGTISVPKVQATMSHQDQENAIGATDTEAGPPCVVGGVFDGSNTNLTFHITGDAYVDFFCFLDGDWPENGGDSRLDQPVKAYAGGSSTNTATHLKALVNHFLIKPPLAEYMSAQAAAMATSATPTQMQIQSRTQSNSQTASLFDDMHIPAPQVVLHTVLNPDDHYGKLLVRHAKDHNFPIINCRKTGDDTTSTGHCIAIVSGGERSFMTHQGCVGNFSGDDLQTSNIIDTLSDVHVHVAGFYSIPGFWDGRLREKLSTIRIERRRRHPHRLTTLSLVSQHDATKGWDGGIDDIVPLLDFFIMNDLEARHIVQRGKSKRNGDLSKQHDVEAKNGGAKNEIDEWVSYFGSICHDANIIVTRGELGAVAMRGGKLIANQAAIHVKPLDPTGAGDSFTAGFLHGIWSWKRSASAAAQAEMKSNGSNGRDILWPVEAIKEALQWGCAVGTSAILIRGASVPADPQHIEAFRKQAIESSKLPN